MSWALSPGFFLPFLSVHSFDLFYILFFIFLLLLFLAVFVFIFLAATKQLGAVRGSASKAQKKFESAKAEPQRECAGDFFGEFPNVNFACTITPNERNVFIDFYKTRPAKTAAEERDESLRGQPLARAMLLENLTYSQELLNISLAKMSGRLVVTSVKNKIESSFSNGIVKVELDGSKAGTIDFNAMQMTVLPEGTAWKITPVKQKTLFIENTVGFLFEKKEGVSAGVKVQRDENIPLYYRFKERELFSKSQGLQSASANEKAVLMSGAILAELNLLFKYNWLN
jgi:hypothetical protein